MVFTIFRSSIHLLNVFTKYFADIIAVELLLSLGNFSDRAVLVGNAAIRRVCVFCEQHTVSSSLVSVLCRPLTVSILASHLQLVLHFSCTS